MKQYKLHLPIWILFIGNEILATQFAAKGFRPLYNYLTFYTLNISLFYINALILLPYIFKNRKTALWKFPLLIATEIICYLFIAFYLRIMLTHGWSAIGKFYLLGPALYPFVTIWRCIYFLGYAIGYYYFKSYITSELANKEAEQVILKQLLQERKVVIELSQAKNAMLKAQVNPHFLFNAFHKLHAMGHTGSKQISHAVLLLSKIMRFSLENDQEHGLIVIDDELKHVNHLIEFGDFGATEPVYIKIDCEDFARHQSLIPLILITLVENMLKHGELGQSDDPGILKISCQENTIIIKTENRMCRKLLTPGLQSGLENIRQRLSFHYGDQGSILHHVQDELFLVEIRVSLTV